ncbi:hypothetical protein [Pseudoroseicyclus tamaricis]|uniref:Uncharacterized protein n=1 Tax=Pseudoroseicyclus tamaricis TaxID=2705421 RepID=A0A6B2JZI2_9RHOB|nr:hypothetical protein [Pseudoroseicyclus tamaricis]NDV01674.1 hypothetical protein [Pseudoroseicyclus tamaricis]
MSEGRNMSGTGRAGIAGAAFAAGLAGCAMDGLEAADCAIASGFAASDVPQDLGNGTVVTRLTHSGGAADDYWGAERYEVTACGSGEWVRMTSMAFASGGEVLSDRRFAVTTLIDAASALAAADVPVYLAERAVSNNIEYRAGRGTLESCGCQVFYPDSAATAQEGTT